MVAAPKISPHLKAEALRPILVTDMHVHSVGHGQAQKGAEHLGGHIGGAQEQAAMLNQGTGLIVGIGKTVMKVV